MTPQEVRTAALTIAARMMGELPDTARFDKFALMGDYVLTEAARFERFINDGAKQDDQP